MTNVFTKKIILLINFTFLALFLIACENNEQAISVIKTDNTSFKELKAKINTKYTLTTADGTSIIIDLKNNKLEANQFKGKAILINFWATWCPPCIEEMPMLNKLYKDNKDDIVIIGVLYEKDKNAKELKSFIKKYKIKFPVTIGQENFRLAKNIGDVRKIPESFLYSKNGKFIKRYTGIISEEELIKEFQNLNLKCNS